MTRAVMFIPSAVVLGAALLGAQGRLGGASVETRSAAQGLTAEVRRAAGRDTASWIGYRVPMVAGARRLCCADGIASATCRLDGGGGVTMNVGTDADAKVAGVVVEPSSELVIFARAEAGRIVRLRTFTPDCDLEAAGSSVVWLNEVKPDESVLWLETLITPATSITGPRSAPDWERVARPAIAAIALHDTPSAVPLLVRMVRTTKDADLRRQAMFWLGQSHDPRATGFFEEILRGK